MGGGGDAAGHYGDRDLSPLLGMQNLLLHIFCGISWSSQKREFVVGRLRACSGVWGVARVSCGAEPAAGDAAFMPHVLHVSELRFLDIRSFSVIIC